jgi:hypothetical protein
MAALVKTITGRLESGHYETHPAQVATNLKAIDALKTTASKVAASAGAASILADATAVSERLRDKVAPRSAAATPPETATAKPTFLDRVRKYSINFANGHYLKHPGDIEKDIAELREMGAALQREKEETKVATIAKIIDNIETQRRPAVAATAAHNSGAAAAPLAYAASAERRETAVSPVAAARSNAFAAVAARPHGGIADEARREIATSAAPYNERRETAAMYTEIPANPCPQLYDPCTQAPLPSIAALEKRVREIKKGADTTPVGLYGLTNATTNFDFLMGPFLEKSIALDDLVSFKLNAGGQVGADIFEVLSRMFVFFGGIADVNPQQGGNYHYMEKAEASAPRVFVDPRQAFQEMKCKASSKYGVSDITLVRTAGAAGGVRISKPFCESDCDIPADGIIKTYLMSVKWYKDEKNAEHYDLEKLKATADKVLSPEQQPYGIIVFLKSKRDFERAHQRASRQYIRHIGNTYFGWEEDVKPFLQDIRRQIFEEAELRGADPRQIMNDRYFVVGAKPSLGLQLHQEIITKSVCDALRASEDNRYLIGVLPRGGKTYIAGGIIREYIMRNNPPALNILWLTAAPTETFSQVGKDLIEKFQDFADFEFIYVRDSAEFKKTTAKPYSFFFCSTQLLTQPKAGIERKNRKYLEELLTKPGQLGLIFYDEAHKTATGTKTREEVDNILKAYETIKLPLIFLTATYYNILFEYRILPENTFIWDYTDVLKTRGLASESDQEAAVKNLRDRFRNPALVDSILDRRRLNGEPLSAMGKPYLEFPDLYFISADFQREALERFDSQGAYRPNSGFSMSSIFGTRPEATLTAIKTSDGRIRADAYSVFENIVNARNMISLITPKEEFGDGLEGGQPLTQESAMLEPSLLGRIDALSRTMDSRFRLDQNPTLLMFMPTGGTGSSIDHTLCAWAALLMKHPWWKARYEVACVVDIRNLTAEELADAAGLPGMPEPAIHILKNDPKAEIMALERKLHCPAAGSAPKGLVILAGQKLSMGVSLPCTDVVFLFNDSRSPDDIIQKMYRGLTPSPGKKAAFVVDLNPVRSLAAVYSYTRTANSKANTSKAILDIIYDTYSWDADVFDIALSKGAGARPQRFQDKLRQLFEKAAADPEYRIYEEFGGLERRLETNIRSRLNTDYVKSLTAHFTERRGSTGAAIELRDGASAFMKAGKLVYRRPSADNAASAGAAAAANAESKPDVTEVVIDNFIETVSDFVKYLAITSSHETLEEALSEYEHVLDFKRNVDQLLYDRADMKGIDPVALGQILVGAVRNFSIGSSEAMFRQMKGVVDDSETRKNAILQVINKRLTPRQKQRKEHGEVFTPLKLIKEMLDHLPEDIWMNPDLKWLDPANGIGNFPVAVFYRLDEGLKTVIPDANARRKHIIENMLYMIELQSSNNRIAKNIFEKLSPGCSSNIWTANTLEVTQAKLAAKGWPSQFDIVMGNPPFQKGRYMMFYVYFLEKANDFMKPGGYLVYVIPNKILIPNKANESLHNFNPLIVYHTINKEYFPSISTTICALIAKKEPFNHETTVKFSNKQMILDLDKPTPTQYNDADIKEISDKIFFGRDVEYISMVKSKPESDYIYISRVWKRYSPDKPEGGGSHIFQITDEPASGVDGRYVAIPDYLSKKLLIWYLTRSEVIRFITKIYAGAMNVPPFIWGLIPIIHLTKEDNDDVYELLHLSKKDQTIIIRTLADNQDVKDDEAEGGARRSKYGQTRKIRR